MINTHSVLDITNTHNLIESERWVDTLKSNPNAALEWIYTSYKAPCIRWIQGVFNIKEDEAIDIFQSSIAILYENATANKIRNHAVSAKSYLIGICKYQSQVWLRNEHKYVKSLTNELLIKLSDTSFDDNSQFVICMRCINTMSPQCREVISLYYLENKSLAQISEIMGYKNENTTKSRKFKCLKRLKKMMGE